VVVVAVLALSFILPGMLKSGSDAAAGHGMSMGGAAHGAGLPVGSRVPAFSERDVETGQPISRATLSQGKTLLFFSEGVMCQACFEQIKGLEGLGAELAARDIRLVSITPDGPGDLKQAISSYGIRTPMISDADRTMSGAFNTLGQGMHGDTPGHAFALIGGGRVLWYRDYWLAPTRSMYVQPAQVLADMSQAAKTGPTG